MNQFQQEEQRKEKIFKVYVVLFVIFILINVILFFLEGSILRGIITLLIFSIVLYYSLQKRTWADLIVKWMVWLYVALLIIILLAEIYIVLQ